MPTYQYSCTEPECGHAFEQVQSFTDDALTVCPQCEGRLRKVFNAVGVVFKGSGFYRTDSRTDSRSDSRADAASAEKPGASAETGSGSDAKGETPAGSSSSSSSSTPASSSSTSTSSPSAPAGAGAA